MNRRSGRGQGQPHRQKDPSLPSFAPPRCLHAKHRILRFLLGGHPPARAALGILPSSREPLLEGRGFTTALLPPLHAGSRDRRKLDEPGGFRMSKTSAAA
jgi:hypothetical protein